jgi:hypothetical protein
MKYAIEKGVRCHDIHTKFHEDWFRHSKADSGGYAERMEIA